MKTLFTTWLIRHGQSESNAGQKTFCPASSALTERGFRQSLAVARAIPIQPARIIASSYKRSQQTAEVLHERFPDTPVVEWPIHEFTYLALEDYRGTTVDDRRTPVEQYWRTARPHDVLGPGAESFAQFIDRVLDVRDRLLAATNGPIAVVSHKKFLSSLLWVLLNGTPKISARQMRRYRGFDHGLSIKNGAILPAQLHEGSIRIGPIETAHLSEI